MCDWPSSPIIWFSDAIEGGLGRRAERERLVLGAHGVPVDAAQRLVVVLVAHRPPGGVQDRPARGRARVGAALGRGGRAGRRTAAAGRAVGRLRGAPRSARRGRRGRRRRRRAAGCRTARSASAATIASAASVDASARPAAAPARCGGGGAREAGDVAAREHAGNVGRVPVVDDGREPAAGGVERDARAVLARQLRRGRGQRRDGDQIARDGRRRPSPLALAGATSTPRSRLPPSARHDGWRATSTRSTSTPAAASACSSGAAVGAASRMTTRAPARHGPDAPAERQPAQRARRDHARAIVVGERQVLIVGARRVERALRAHAHQARLGRHRQHAGLAVGARRPRERSRSRSRSSTSARARGRARRPPASRARSLPPALGVQRAAGRGLLVVDDDPRARRGAGDLARGAEAGRARRRPRRRRRPRPSSTVAGASVVGQRARAAHLAHHLEEHGVAGPAARHQRVVVHAAREQPVGGGQDVDVGAREGVLALAAQPVARRDHAGPPVGPPVDAHACTRRSGRRGRTGPAGGGTWATAPACGCRRRTAPPRRARPRAPEPASPRSRWSPARPPAARPQIPAGSFHARHSNPRSRSTKCPCCLTFRRRRGSGRTLSDFDDRRR